ncbi:MAG: spinster family MFS transporter [Allosphingosinicella sp.]
MSDTDGGGLAAPSKAYANYVLGVLFVVNVFNIVDRSIMGLLVDPVKREMTLTDTQMSLLTGFAFVLFYLMFGIFIARLADRGSRRLVLAVGIAIWSVMTALTGAAQDYATLLVARIGVGIGEAACFPVAMSLIGDYFPSAKRPRAVSIFQASQYVAIVGGLVLIGWLAEYHGWRAAFVAVGLPGLLVAALFLLTVREPERGRHDADTGEAPERFGPALRTILGNTSLVGLIFVMGLGTMGIVTLASWSPPFLQRIHGLSVGEVGSVVGPAVGLPGLVGTVGAGFIASWLVKRSGRDSAALVVPLVGLLLAGPAFVLFVFADTLPLAVVGLALGNLCVSTVFGPPVAVALSLAPARLRALTSSVLLVVQSLIGAGLGPFIVGYASDALAPAYGVESLRYALVLVPIAPLLASALLAFVYSGMRRAAGAAPLAA